MLREVLLVSSLFVVLCASKIGYIRQNAGYMFVTDILVVLGGKHQVSGWKCSHTRGTCGKEQLGGTGLCGSVVASAAVLCPPRRGCCKSAELLCLEHVPFMAS